MTRLSLSTLVATALITLTGLFVPHAAATPCVQFDADFNLYAFGVNGQDFNLGKQDQWAGNPKGTALTATGRPPFDGPNTQCFLAQFFNAIYVVNGDKANPNNVHIFNAASQTWSTQTTTVAAGFDPNVAGFILDHDTNVFFALSGKTIYQLDMTSQNSAKPDPVVWDNVQDAGFDATNYKPVMAIAQNHIHFLDVPSSQPGQAFIFVIHFSFSQPDPQSYPAKSGSTFPVAHGQVASFFNSDISKVQEQFAFIPDDGSATYLINVETNTTVPLAGPTIKTPGSSYAAGPGALVQLTSQGQMYFLNVPSTGPPSGSPQWSQINAVLAAPQASPSPSSSAPPTPSASGFVTMTSPSPATGSATPSSSPSSPSSKGSNAAMGVSITGAGLIGVMTSAIFAVVGALVL